MPTRTITASRPGFDYFKFFFLVAAIAGSWACAIAVGRVVLALIG